MLKTQYNKLQQDCAKWFATFYFNDGEDDDVEWNLKEAYWIWEGTVLSIGDVFINMEDIVFLEEIDSEVSLFRDWYWWSVEQEHTSVKLKTYVSMRVTMTHEEIVDTIKT